MDPGVKVAISFPVVRLSARWSSSGDLQTTKKSRQQLEREWWGEDDDARGREVVPRPFGRRFGCRDVPSELWRSLRSDEVGQRRSVSSRSVGNGLSVGPSVGVPSVSTVSEASVRSIVGGTSVSGKSKSNGGVGSGKKSGEEAPGSSLSRIGTVSKSGPCPKEAKDKTEGQEKVEAKDENEKDDEGGSKVEAKSTSAEFPCLLGRSNPCPSVVQMEASPASYEKGISEVGKNDTEDKKLKDEEPKDEKKKQHKRQKQVLELMRRELRRNVLIEQLAKRKARLLELSKSRSPRS